jgi:hypothetical protein
MLCAHCNAEISNVEASCPECREDPMLDGRYELLEVLGQGAAGTTYRGRARADGRVVAIKEVLVRRVSSVKALALFEREAQVLEQLEHPGIPRYIDDFSAGGGKMVGLYLVQEYIDGQSLADEVRRRRYTEPEVLAIIAELLDIVAYLQALEPPVIHRDLKPANVMRRRDGRLVLIDFGVVKDVLKDADDGGSTVAGTFGYMAPEQLMGRAAPTTDIYGVGALAVALLSRREPQDLMGSEHRLEWRGAVDVAPEVEALLGAMLRPEPDQRPRSAAALADALRRYLAGDPSPLRALVGAGAPPPSQAPAAPLDVAKLLEQGLGRKLPSLVGHLLNRMVPNLQPVETVPLGPPPPPAPRPVPRGFTKHVAPVQRFFFFFGALWTAIALLVLVPMALSPMPASVKLLLTVFLLPGLVPLLLSFKKTARLKRTYSLGEATIGRVLETGYNMSLSVNGRHPFRLEYEFEADGHKYNGRVDGWDKKLVARRVGDPVHVLYMKEAPRSSVVYW